MQNKQIKLYHKDIYLPQELINQAINQQQNTEYFSFTKHLISRIANKDKSHFYVSLENINKVLDRLKENPIVPFEVETEIINGTEKVTKYVIRDKCTSFEDIILVIRNNLIITAYVNHSTDEHFTLDCSKYSKF